MRTGAFYLFWVVLPVFSYSQQREIDSLETVLHQHLGQDTVRLNLLNDLAYDYYSYDPNKGLERANEAIELALRLQQTKKLASAYQHKGHNYASKGEDTMALEMYEKAIAIHEKIGNHSGVARTIFNKGLIYFGWSDYKQSTEAYLKAYAVFEKEKDSFLMAKMLNSIGINNMYVSDYPRALSKYLSAARIYEKIDYSDSFEYALVQNNIGLVYNRLEKFEQALAYHEKALELFREFDNKSQIASALSNIGNVYDNLGKPEKAIDLQEQAYEINMGIGNKRGMASNLNNMGIAYTSLSQYNKALEYLNRTKILYEELGDITNLGIVHSYLGDCYLNLVDNRLPIGNRYKKANGHFKKALQLAEQSGSLDDQNIALENIAKTYIQMGNYKDAFEAKNKAISLQDSVRSSEKREEIARLEMRYEFDKKEAATKAKHEKEKVLAQAEIEHQKTIKRASLLGGSGLFAATLFGLFLYKRRRDALEQKTVAEFNTKVADTELKALRSQMNPHFIFNSLNSINAFIAKNDKVVASDYLVKFAKLMRKTLENSEKKEILLKDDLELLETYLDIESKRLDNKFTFEIKVDKAIDIENTLVPPLLLQPFLENSIWHGIAPKNGAGHIAVDVQKKGNMILYSLDDDGVGIKRKLDLEKTNIHKSFGMRLTESRIEIINERKKSNGCVRIIDKDEGVRVEVELPLELAF